MDLQKPADKDCIINSLGHKLQRQDILQGKGPYVYDSNGQAYVDLESGIWCASLGHCHPKVLEALKDQAARIMHTGYCYENPVIREASREILNTLGMAGGGCIFLCSGSEAVEYAVRAARFLVKKPRMLMLGNSYFGAYGSAAEKREHDFYVFDWLSCRSCPDYENCPPDCPKIRGIPFEELGGFLFEPGSSAGLVRFPSVSLMANLTTLIKRNGGYLLVNEVTTGVGRTGKWYGFQHYTLTPDFVALGKGLGSGYPVAAMACRRDLAAKLSDNSFRYSQSHQNDPLGAAVALSVIRTIREEGLVEHSAELGGYLLSELQNLAKDFPEIVKQARGRGLMLLLEFQDRPGKPPLGAQVQEKLLNEGFIVSPRPGFNAIRIDPPLIITREILEDFTEALRKILSELSS